MELVISFGFDHFVGGSYSTMEHGGKVRLGCLQKLILAFHAGTMRGGDNWRGSAVPQAMERDFEQGALTRQVGGWFN